MIRVLRQALADAEAEAVVRPVRSDGEAITGPGRRLEVAAVTDWSARLGEMGDLPVGVAVLTPGGELPASFVIHVVVQSPEEPVTAAGVRRGLVNVLRRASEFGIDSLALPPLGVGPG
ncbi:MAG TPA: macro domain-containing protein, partial [Longimicrobiales bacterium]|nr:macro domain-containing protein [Longimicrobiales bacterium]